MTIAQAKCNNSHGRPIIAKQGDIIAHPLGVVHLLPHTGWGLVD